MRALAVSLRLALLAAGALLLVVGPPDVVEELAVRTVEERVPGAAAGPSDGAPYDRVLRVGAVDLDALAASVLVPDPRAVRTHVRAAGPGRVLDPAAITLEPLAVPHAGRPLALSVRVRGARAADRLEWEYGAATGKLAGRVEGGVRHATFELERVGAAQLRVVWRGERAGRAGHVVASFRLDPVPPARCWLGPGVREGGPIARALALQGFERASEPAPAALAVLSLGVAAPDWLRGRVDGGMGCLLVAAAGQPFHPSFREIAPVLAVPRPGAIGPRPLPGGDEATAGGPANGPETRDPKERRGPANPPRDPEAVRRPGPVPTQEKSDAMRDTRSRKTRAVALVIVLDRSGSMQLPARTPRIALAKKGALASAAGLGAGDEFALVTFGRNARVAVPLGSASRKDELRRAIGAIRATAQQTNGYPGLETAWRLLKRTAAPVRHVVILTDGDFQDAFKPYGQLLSSMRKEGIGVSGLGVAPESGALGVGQFAFLKELLEKVEGKLVVTSDPNEIPRLLLGEVQEVVGQARPMRVDGPGEVASKTEPEPENVAKRDDPAARQGPEPPVRGEAEEKAPRARHALVAIDPEPVLAGLEDAAWPPVAGYLPLEARLRARVHLAVGSAGHGYLVSAPFGLGRVAVLAGTDGAPWAAQLTAQPFWPRVVGQVAAWLLPARAKGVTRTGALERGPAEVLSGRGPAPEALAEVARRTGATLGATLGGTLGGTLGATPVGERTLTRTRPGDPWPWLLGLLAGLLLVLGVEARATVRPR